MRRGMHVNYRSYRSNENRGVTGHTPQDRYTVQQEARFNTHQQHRQSASLVVYNNQGTTSERSSLANTYSLEGMIAYIRDNPSAALGVHEHLTYAQYPRNHNVPLVSSTPQTPKRTLETSANDGAQTAKQQRVQSNGNRQNTDRINSPIAPQLVCQPNAQQNQVTLQHKRIQPQQHRLPFDQLKRAVSSNLPCFLVEYNPSMPHQDRPSDVTTARMIEEHFLRHGISITFSLVGHVGNKLKLGVNNKEVYATLNTTDNWPSQINNIAITVIKPKYIPDSFALVVRYVLNQYDDELVKDEIQQNLQSAENIKRIRYSFQRKSNDFRFTVKDLREYNATLKLGRISIGNTLCIITPFLTGNRMTYCTRCWCLGHM
ncbi:unnamed protein product [Didymodactylos carnosus]|uniref:Uncharacterized protein n=1 Tax=Didymodactylos carnosus TaxID=1234261 RepID=A0A814L681_9BILA|nr:unnamed protein product [Didymodactylos carnosus]CAF1061539.1 unnamed protein product [Didymodactylos carnosus]CAF3599588.1 unnamed protein product [Didymodactylos carnosus]CAF3829795.1 unnamed protein product [Didymodactylos carnosus]